MSNQSSCCASSCANQALKVAIIGSGSAAFACAIKVAEGGAEVTIIESAEVIGGCCVNVGCVPSKILIRVAQLAQQQRSNPFDGLANQSPQLNRAVLAQQQAARVDELRQAKYENILQANSALRLIKGRAQFMDKHTLRITQADGSEQSLVADRILIATGSTPTLPTIKGLHKTPYWTSTEALFAEQLPQHLLIIGSSVIAVEIAQAYRRLGAQVTLFARHHLLSSEDPQLGAALTAIFAKEGIQVMNETEATAIHYSDELFTVETNNGIFKGDKLLISTGRKANSADLALEKAGVNTTAAGNIIVNAQMQTNIESIYAAGDCTINPQYVYVAAAGGSRAGSNMTGTAASLDLNTLPAVIFTDPQVANVGLNEAQAQAQGIQSKSRTLDLSHVPRALANYETDGFIKLVINADSGRLIGAQILAENAGDVIQTAALAILNKMTVDDLANQLFPYLTMVEGLKLCAQTFNKDVSELSCCAG